MPEKVIRFFGQPAKVACDGKCNKAWGDNSRPKIQLSDDVDDYAYLADGELGEAPIASDTSAGGDGKPLSADYFPNKWCVNECERCAMSAPDEYDKPLELPDFGGRVFNMHWRREVQDEQ